MNWEQKKKIGSVLVTILMVTAIIIFALTSCGAVKTEENEVVPEKPVIEYAGIEEYEVGCFETLSHIAAKYIPSDEYMQEWINDVKKLNGRKTTDIYFGEVIRVYVYE